MDRTPVVVVSSNVDGDVDDHVDGDIYLFIEWWVFFFIL